MAVGNPAYRGVIEGFYGPMWSHAERLHLVQHLREWNMNLYIYSPRDDPYHRFHWDTPYPADEMRRFGELAAAARAAGVGFAYAISPGNTFEPARTAHRRALVDKLRPFIDLGCMFFPIFYDDLEKGFDPDSAAGARHADMQARLMNGLAADIARLCPHAAFLFCPTQYMTAEKSRYLCRLHARLDPRIETVVTGVDPDTDSVCPRTFSDAGARRYFEHFGRRPFLWDNFNVRDNSLNTLHWSPYSGRGASLPSLCSGIVLNPQNQYLLNLPVFGCFGDYLADPPSYDPPASFRRHVAALMGEEAAPLGLELSRWFTAEWFARAGDGFRSSEANLPALPAPPLGPRPRRALLAAIRRNLAPLQGFKDRFSRTRMPPEVAGALVPYAGLLAEYARAMTEFCDAAAGTARAADAGAGKHLLARVDRPETECFRLPLSLIAYAREVAALGAPATGARPGASRQRQRGGTQSRRARQAPVPSQDGRRRTRRTTGRTR